MTSQEEKMRLIDDALLVAVSESGDWARQRSQTGSGNSEYWVEVQSPFRPSAQRLVVLLRHDGDIQVEYHFADAPGSPFEMFFALPKGQEKQAIAAVALFVADLIAERLVLGYAKDLFKGGRRFLKPGSLTESSRRHFDWVTSWRGTFDWLNPG